MDPLSLTASLLAILGAGGAIAKGLDKIRRLKNAPNVLLQLNNEVVDLHLLIRAVDGLYHQHSDSFKTSQHQIIYSILSRAKEALLELEKLISYHWTKETDNGIEINRTAWIRAQKQIAETSSNIRNVRVNLNGAWMVISARDESQRIELKLQQISLSVGHLQQGHSENQSLLSRIASDFSNQGHLHQVLQTDQRSLENITPLRKSQNDSGNVPRKSSPSDEVVSSSSSLSPSMRHSDLIHFRMARYCKCKPACACLCHRKSFIKSPYAWKRVIGSLFVGYTALPKASDNCNTPDCQSRFMTEFQALYIFPRWLVNGAIHVTIELAKNKGPELILRYLRIRPKDSQFFQSILQQNAHHSMSLITAGSGSVLDIDKDGFSAVAIILAGILRNQHRDHPLRIGFELLTNLIREGGDIFLENDFLETPYLFAWRYYLTKPLYMIGCEVIDEILNTTDPSEVLGFNELHSSIAGSRASLSAFEKNLRITPRQKIDANDKTGRTALSWAVELGDLEMTEKLLAKGADPNIADRTGDIPLFYWRSNRRLLKSLLMAGTNANHVNRKGFTKLQILSMTKDDPDLFELLWSYGADLHVRHQITGSLLHSAIMYGMPKIAHWLLHKGVDIEAYAHDGATPLLTIISYPYNNHDITARLLDMSANHKVLDRHGEGLLHCVARFGTFGTMVVLQRAGLSDLNIKHKGNRGFCFYDYGSEGKTALEIAEQRRDNNKQWAIDNLAESDSDPEAWYGAFKVLVDSIEASDTAEQFGDFWGGFQRAQDKTHGNENVEINVDVLPQPPGSYPKE